MKHANSLYRFVSTAKSWFAARRTCLIQGAHLADIDDVAENSFVVMLAGNKSDGFWIGMNDNRAENNFVKSDGSIPQFFNWYGYEPNGKSFENCVEIIPGEIDGKKFNGRWNDRSCFEWGAFVCEKSQGNKTY